MAITFTAGALRGPDAWGVMQSQKTASLQEPMVSPQKCYRYLCLLQGGSCMILLQVGEQEWGTGEALSVGCYTLASSACTLCPELWRLWSASMCVGPQMLWNIRSQVISMWSSGDCSSWILLFWTVSCFCLHLAMLCCSISANDQLGIGTLPLWTVIPIFIGFIDC